MAIGEISLEPKRGKKPLLLTERKVMVPIVMAGTLASACAVKLGYEYLYKPAHAAYVGDLQVRNMLRIDRTKTDPLNAPCKDLENAIDYFSKPQGIYYPNAEEADFLLNISRDRNCKLPEKME